MKKTLKSDVSENLVEMVLRGYATMVADIIWERWCEMGDCDLYYDDYDVMRNKIFKMVVEQNIIRDVEKLMEEFFEGKDEDCLKDLKHLCDCIPDWV